MTHKVHTKFPEHKSDNELDKIMGNHEPLETLEGHHQPELKTNIYSQFRHITGQRGPLNKTILTAKAAITMVL